MYVMITVIIAGGSGTRLWPLSTPSYPKHLLKIDGDDKTLLQHTCERVKHFSDKLYVVTEIGHAHHIKEQLPDLSEDSFIIEPARRGTASCIIAALARISSVIDPDEPIAFVSADHHIRDTDGFVQSFKIAADASKEHGRIVLIGVEPDYPATGFGYIQKDGLVKKDSLLYNVHSFKEKPDHEVAEEYVRSGNYLWNCSYFIGSLSTFKKALEKHAPDLLAEYKQLLAVQSPKEYEASYLALENNSIDYALIEKIEDLLVIPAAFDWMDVGSYNDLHKAVVSDKNNNYISGPAIEAEGVENTYICNYEDKPLAVIGLDNVVVINTKDGILVARKDLSQKVGEVSKRINK